MANSKRKGTPMTGVMMNGREISKRPRTSASQVMTRSATMTSLHNAVFLTTELVENILGHLPMRDLLLAQRVSRKWAGIIKKSLPMQQTLYFKPREAHFSWRYNYGDGISDLESLQRVKLDYTPTSEEAPTTLLIKQADPNPLIMTSDHHDDFWDNFSSGGCALMAFTTQIRHPSWRYPEASWRRMLISQPPYTQLIEGNCYCTMPCPQNFRDWHSVSGPKREQGLTAGDLVNDIEASYELAEDELCRAVRISDIRSHFLTFSGMTSPSVEQQKAFEEWIIETRAEEALQREGASRAEEAA